MKAAGIGGIAVVVVLLVVFPFFCMTGDNVDEQVEQSPGDRMTQPDQTHAPTGMQNERTGTPGNN